MKTPLLIGLLGLGLFIAPGVSQAQTPDADTFQGKKVFRMTNGEVGPFWQQRADKRTALTQRTQDAVQRFEKRYERSMKLIENSPNISAARKQRYREALEKRKNGLAKKLQTMQNADNKNFRRRVKETRAYVEKNRAEITNTWGRHLSARLSALEVRKTAILDHLTTQRDAFSGDTTDLDTLITQVETGLTMAEEKFTLASEFFAEVSEVEGKKEAITNGLRATREAREAYRIAIKAAQEAMQILNGTTDDNTDTE